ncbi:hypothetical protein P3TCK_01564 [Photobacterium profundum 3TCK]|uniref:Uncharacterized protein n=1 Tax=Photobacterium profundum 3TCK TaxID=314280 RepID=Q1Z4W8_9GAMM|nr:hypothetical protein P3TCK_01564 [Photobacterium profundum 3TCK]
MVVKSVTSHIRIPIKVFLGPDLSPGRVDP